MSPDAKILLAYFVVVCVLVPSVASLINSIRKRFGNLYEEDVGRTKISDEKDN